MPKRRRHQPGKYKPRPAPKPNFSGPKPLTLFKSEYGLWGAKDGVGNIVIEPQYVRAEQTEQEKKSNSVHLVSQFEVLTVTPDDWDLISSYCPD